jgi:hypothetical protein
MHIGSNYSPKKTDRNPRCTRSDGRYRKFARGLTATSFHLTTRNTKLLEAASARGFASQVLTLRQSSRRVPDGLRVPRG